VVGAGQLISNTYPLIGFGPELNPDPFFGNPGLWTFGVGWSIDQNTAKVDGLQVGTSHLEIGSLLEPETLYRMEVSFPAISAGLLRQAAGGDGVGEWQSAPILNLVEFLNTGSGVTALRVTGDLNAIGDCTFLSCRKVLNP